MPVQAAPVPPRRTEVESGRTMPEPHLEARKQQPKDPFERPKVKDEHVPWHKEAPEYAPRSTNFPLVRMDEQGMDWTATLREAGGLGVILSGEKTHRLNPGGRTGLVGGWSEHAHAGANRAVDPIITRFRPDAKEPTLQLLAGLRRDCNAWALPGAMIRTSETVETAMRRGLAEKGVDSKIVSLLRFDLPEASDSGYIYIDDSRNTDDAWIESTVYKFHLEDQDTTVSCPGVKWVDISGAGGVNIFKPHRLWVKEVADELLNAPMLERKMRGVRLKLLFRPLELNLTKGVRLVRCAPESSPSFNRLLACSEKQSEALTINESGAISSVTHVELRLDIHKGRLRPEVEAQMNPAILRKEAQMKWVRCRCAPFAPIAVGWESRNRFSIPQDATHQAFVYGPLDAADAAFAGEVMYPDPKTAHFEQLLVSGGFVYAKCEGQQVDVLRVTHVDNVDENDLYSKNHVVEFKGPHRMEEGPLRHAQKQEHWTPVSLSFLLAAGAHSFMWLNPGEHAGTHPIKFGAFASEDNSCGAAADMDLKTAGVMAPVEVAREHSSKKNNAVDASDAAHKAAAHNWFLFHDAVAMGNASLVESLIKDDRLLPEEMVESQLTRRELKAALSRTGTSSALPRSFSPAEQSSRASSRSVDISRVDVPDGSSSLTPLMVAAEYGHGDVVRTLIRRGASPTAQAKDGATAMDHALRVPASGIPVEQLLCKLDAAIALLPALFRHSAGEALCYVTKIAERAHIERERRERSSPAEAEKLQATADRAERLGVELIKKLSVLQRTLLLEREKRKESLFLEGGTSKEIKRPPGFVARPRGFVARAVNVPRQKKLLGDPTVQAAINYRWMGPLINSVVNGYVVTPNGDEERVRRPFARVVLLLLAAAVNLLFLPLVAFIPRLRRLLMWTLDFGFELVSSDRTPYSEGFQRKWSPSAQLYTRSLYLLDAPFFQFFISSVSWLLLSLVLTRTATPSLRGAVADAWALLSSEGADGIAPALATVVEEVGSLALNALLLSGLLLWLLAHFIDEIETFSWSDPIKKGELLGISLALSSKLAPMFNRHMLAFGLLLMWLSWFMRVFSLGGLGTLTVMLEKMLFDTVKFLVFMVGCAVAFAAALHQLFLEAHVLDVEDCDKFSEFGEGLLVSLRRLLLVAIDPAESIDCAGTIAEALQDFHFTAPFIMSVYVILSVVLLLNMLIAIMAKTFDTVWDDAETENRYLRAQLAVQYFGDAPPPPFNLLRLPARVPELLERCWAKVSHACGLAATCCYGAGKWLVWLACLPCLAVWAVRRAWALPRQDKSSQEGLFLSEGLSTDGDMDDLDPSNVRYVDGLGQLWSERNTVEELMKLEAEGRSKEERKE
ncbi:hypothetical protein EMIHUDRAFT_201068 [Emiliania huxleyi CCMP1516]|uniref:Ion transport domain-containing protein n=2 Tax=Emiliania huxleyi TaxID=2903 RepID=A0A0D3KM35_EMIH1|nr:hypothetical protein EMIHUDRAFT_201068 [Emiliania huxleyi CCMP1516]EOD36820.1 hypothetical protein EMIHUDRAFT_201068 [Emiliania huxleyi CCMP1516]|eukprot:XP_005789249.1 hypothetical protein EMIHUDRAFT_201068 [Emiliania huxleyi CCMP1516]